MKRKTIWLAATLALVGGMGPDLIRHKARLPCLPGIPAREYQFLPPLPQPSPLVQGVSFGKIELAELPSVGVPTPVSPIKVRTFSLSVRELKVNHCSISQVAFSFEPDGRWILNLRADQNPWFTTEPDGLPPRIIREQMKIETNHFLRNEFFVTVRCYGNFPLKEDLPSTGKPALAVIGPLPFWVQRGVPYLRPFNGECFDLARYYPLIDRIEFDLYYKK